MRWTEQSYDRIRKERLKQKLKFNEHIRRKIRRLKWKWAGHAGRIKDDYWTYKLTFCYPKQHKRKVGKQTTKWTNRTK